MSTQPVDNTVPPLRLDTETGINTQDPTPAQAAERQAMRATRKGKEAAAGRPVSNAAAEEKRGRQYSPYHKRDKEGEANGGDPPQGGGEQRREQQLILPAATPAQQGNPPRAHLPPTPEAQTAQATQQPLAQLPIPLVPPPAATQAAAPPIQDVEMAPTAGNATTGPEDDITLDQPENPHLQTTRAVPLTTIPPRPGKGYAGGPFPRTVIDSDDLFKSIRPEILENLLAEPQDFLLLLPYGAGKRLHAEFPSLGDDILEYLREFRAPNCEGIKIVKAACDTVMRGKKPKMYRKDFEAPWAFILSGFSTEFKDFLLGVGVFDFAMGEANHAFTVLKIQRNVRSWHVAYLAGDGVAGDQQTINEGLAAIKKKLKNNTKVRTAVLDCYAGRTEPHLASTDDKVQDALSSLSITFTSDGNKKYWHLTAKPITDEPGRHENWLKALRDGKSFVIGKILAVDITWGFERCDFCKNESHPESACPFARAQGWKGPKPSEVRARWSKADKKEEEGSQWHPERGQHGGRGRGGRDQRGGSSRGSNGGGAKRQSNRARPY